MNIKITLPSTATSISTPQPGTISGTNTDVAHIGLTVVAGGITLGSAAITNPGSTNVLVSNLYPQAITLDSFTLSGSMANVTADAIPAVL